MCGSSCPSTEDLQVYEWKRGYVRLACLNRYFLFICACLCARSASSTRYCWLTAVDVYINRCLDNIVAGGVQISGLHATVAPRRQQLQSSPTLEEFAFVPNVDAQCLRSNGKLAEELRVCRGTVSCSSFSASRYLSMGGKIKLLWPWCSNFRPKMRFLDAVQEKIKLS